MGKIVLFESVTLDGVMQAPGRPDEDPRGKFAHGGWAVPYADESLGKIAAEGMATTGGILLGRRTYEDFYGFWPKQADNPYSEMLTKTPKFVASTKLKEPLPWENSTLIDGDAVKAVKKLKKESPKDIVLLGSGELARALIEAGLIDQYTLLVHPLVLGSGQRLFGDNGQPTSLRLVDTKTTDRGVLIATFDRRRTRPDAHVR